MVIGFFQYQPEYRQFCVLRFQICTIKYFKAGSSKLLELILPMFEQVRIISLMSQEN